MAQPGTARQIGVATPAPGASPVAALNAVLALLLAAGLTAGALAWGSPDGLVGLDAHAYWSIRDGELYGSSPRAVDAFLYSPAFAAAIWPLVQLPWWWFYALWVSLAATALVWLVAPLPRRWAAVAVVAALPELIAGNIYLMLAVMVALGVRHPGVWAFGVLTKVTPGVGMLWHLVRGEWRLLTHGVLVLAGVTLASVLVTPGWWHAWLHFLADNAGSGDPSLVPRCVLAVALVVLGARTERAWLLAPAVVLSLPVLGLYASWIPLLAVPRLRQGAVAPRPGD